MTFRPPATSRGRARSAAATASRWSSTRSRPGSAEPGGCSRARSEGVAPDVLLLGKGLGGGLFPLSACLVADDWWDERFALGHSSTFANNNVACGGRARGAARATGDGDGARPGGAGGGARRAPGRGLRRLAARYPRVVADARGRGLLWALELRPADEAQGLLLGYLQHQGLYAYAAAAVLAEQSSVLALPTLGTANVLRIAPPLVVSDEEIDLDRRRRRVDVRQARRAIRARPRQEHGLAAAAASGAGPRPRPTPMAARSGRRPRPRRCRPHARPRARAIGAGRSWSTTRAPRTCG